MRAAAPLFTSSTLAGHSLPITPTQYSPHGIAINTTGTILVTDGYGHRILVLSNGVYSTLAGSGTASFADGTGTSASFNVPGAVALDSTGVAYIADTSNQRIRVVNQAGVVTTLAGNGTAGYADGAGANAMFTNPSGIAVDASGNVYVADAGNSVIRAITPGGVVTTLAGSPGVFGYADGTGTAANFNNMKQLAIDSSGNIFVADYSNYCVRKVTPAGVVTSMPGCQQYSVTSVAVDPSGNVFFYYPGYNYNVMYKIAVGSSSATTFAGRSGVPSSVDGVGTLSAFNNGNGGMTSDASGNVYMFEDLSIRIRKISPTANVTTLAGTGTFADGNGTSAMFYNSYGIAVDANGTAYIADTGNHRVRIVSKSGAVSTLAGSGTPGFADGAGASAMFNNPSGIAVDASGAVYVADSSNNRIRKVTSSGTVTTLAGSGTAAWSDASGTSASFSNPTGVAVDASGNVYVADKGNNRVRVVSASGVVRTLAGSGANAMTDGVGAGASFKTTSYYYFGIAVDSNGVVYVTDAASNRIRTIATDGTVTTPAALIPASTTVMYNPNGIAVDSGGNIFVTDYSSAIRMVTQAGAFATLTSTSSGYTDGTGSGAQFNNPQGIAVGPNGTLYVMDRSNNLVRTLSGTCRADTYVTSINNCSGVRVPCARQPPLPELVDLVCDLLLTPARNPFSPHQPVQLDRAPGASSARLQLPPAPCPPSRRVAQIQHGAQPASRPRPSFLPFHTAPVGPHLQATGHRRVRRRTAVCTPARAFVARLCRRGSKVRTTRAGHSCRPTRQAHVVLLLMFRPFHSCPKTVRWAPQPCVAWTRWAAQPRLAPP